MPHTENDFAADNMGAPERYTAKTDFARIYIVETDLTVATQARYKVYVPVGGASTQKEPGQEFLHEPKDGGSAGTQPFAIETVNVAATYFTIREE